MASVLEDLFTAIAPEFAGDARIPVFLGLAATRLQPSGWGAVYSEAVVLLAAHTLTLSNRGTSGGADGGQVTARSAGDVSISYSAAVGMSANDAALSLTSYGLQFLELRNSRCVAAPSVVGIV